MNRMSADLITQDELIEELNGLMAEELEASLRYFALSIMVVQPTEAFSELLREVVGETMEHAGWVAKEIRELGGEPKINVKLSSTAVPMTTEEAVAEILIVETAALECYKDLLGLVPVGQVVELPSMPNMIASSFRTLQVQNGAWLHAPTRSPSLC